VTALTYVVAGGPDGEERFEIDAPGDGGTLTFLVEHRDFALIKAGTLDPAVAYMQGRLKVTGDMAALLDLLPALPRP
jgi:putative sterol carrier protein